MSDKETEVKKKTWLAFKPGTPVLSAIVTIGLGAVIAVYWMFHSMSESTDNREFIQDKLIETLQASTKASEGVSKAIESFAGAQERMAKEMDDIGDETRALNRSIELVFRDQLGVEEAQDP